MRDHFMMALLDRMLPEKRPDEDFFAAGPRAMSPVPISQKAFVKPRTVSRRLVTHRNRHA